MGSASRECNFFPNSVPGHFRAPPGRCPRPPRFPGPAAAPWSAAVPAALVLSFLWDDKKKNKKKKLKTQGGGAPPRRFGIFCFFCLTPPAQGVRSPLAC